MVAVAKLGDTLMPAWEYLRVVVTYDRVGVGSPPHPGIARNMPVDETLAVLGTQGWELVSAAHTESDIYSLYFKRPKS
jgi:hypothetical protein